MGVNLDFWKPVKSRGKYDGEPSVLTCENSNRIKWCYDIAIAWPEVANTMKHGRLHINYLPSNQQPAFYPLFYSNGLVYSSYVTSTKLGPEDLRNAFVSVDYYISPVMYGDFNAVCLEAKASGCKIISYVGNPYADYWLTSQDQRVIAADLIRIFKSEVEPLNSQKVIDIKVTGEYMLKIYERLGCDMKKSKSVTKLGIS